MSLVIFIAFVWIAVAVICWMPLLEGDDEISGRNTLRCLLWPLTIAGLVLWLLYQLWRLLKWLGPWNGGAT